MVVNNERLHYCAYDEYYVIKCIDGPDTTDSPNEGVFVCVCVCVCVFVRVLGGDVCVHVRKPATSYMCIHTKAISILCAQVIHSRAVFIFGYRHLVLGCMGEDKGLERLSAMVGMVKGEGGGDDGGGDDGGGDEVRRWW